MSVTVTSWTEYWQAVKEYQATKDSAWKTEIGVIARDFGEMASLEWQQRWDKFYSYCEALIVPIERSIQKNTASSILDGAVGTISSLITGFGDEVESLYTSAVEGIGEFVKPVLESIGELIDDIQSTVKSFAEWVVKAFENMVDLVDDLYEKAVEYMYTLYRSFLSSVDEIINKAMEMIEKVYQYMASEVKTFFEKVTTEVESALQTYADAVNRITGTMVQDASDILDDVSDTVSKTLSTFTEVAEPIVRELSSVTSSIAGELMPAIGLLTAASGHLFNTAETEENISLAREVNESFSLLFTSLAAGAGGAENMFEVYEESGIFRTALGSVLATLGLTMANGLLALTAANHVNAPRIQDLAQKAWAANPTKNYSAPEAAVMAARGILDDSDAYIAGEQDGYSNSRMSHVIENAKTSIDVERAMDAFRREILSEEGFMEALKRLGLRDSDSDVVRELVDVLPPLQDIISMAVRDVFTPETVSKFELFSDLPDEYVREAKKQGLTEEWAERYWGAHWRLPSANQGFEMFHRKVIDEDTMKLLLRALDVSPFWRDKLIQIAYQPITRVDIRRIYKLGLMSYDEVVERHEQIGYSPSDAKLMADFVVSYVGVSEEEDGVDMKSLTMSQIKRLWAAGTISKSDALEAMEAIGYSSSGASLLVESWEDEDEMAFRETLIARLVRKAIRQQMSDTEITALFSSMNPTAEEMTRIRKTIAAEISMYDAVPSKSELVKMTQSGVISYSEWVSAMRLHDYDDYWIEKYRQLYDIGV